jgi:hypothetical protein
MYALIYDDFDPKKREKKVISLHPTREDAARALQERQARLGRRVWECHTRIVWLHRDVHPWDFVTPDIFETWAPDEQIPESDKVPDGD